MKLGNISVTYVDLMTKAIGSLKGDAGPLLERYGLNAKVVASPDARISIPRFMRLGHDAMVALNTPILGLEMGRLMRATHCGLAGLVALSSSDIGRACRALTKYEMLSSYNVRGQSRFYVEQLSKSSKVQQQGVIEFYSISPYNQYNLFVVDYVLMGWCTLLQRFSEQTKIKYRVEFEFDAPDYADQYPSFFNCDVHFGCDRNAVILESDSLQVPLSNHCPSTYSGLEHQANRLLDKAFLGYSFKETVERAIGPLLNGQAPSIEQVAHRLHPTPWTLRRRLANESETYQTILNNTRCDLAKSYVKDTRLSLGEIAYLVGFGSTAAFQRAFKRWTGFAPGYYRIHSRKSS